MNFSKDITCADLCYSLGNKFSFKQAANDALCLNDDCFSSIPSEIFLNIYPFLSLKELALTKLVCRRWSILENGHSWNLFYLVALKGNEIFSQINLTYESLMSFPKNQEQALHELQKPIHNSFARTLFDIGCAHATEKKEHAMKKVMDYYGKFPPEWFCAKSQTIFSICYAEGVGSEVNLIKSFRYCKLAADEGYATAQTLLGLYYRHGKGVEKNLEKAIEYFKDAIHQGCVKAMYCLANLYEKGQKKQKAIEYYTLGADKGEMCSQFVIGICYATGNLVTKDLNQGNRYLQLSAQQGYAPAEYYLGLHYVNGIGFDKNFSQAALFFERAAKQDHVQALFRICLFYEMGIGVDRNPQQAAHYFQRLKDSQADHTEGNPLGCIGFCYLKGIGAPQDAHLALHYFKLARNLGDIRSQNALGYFHEVILNDPHMATAYYKEAADNCHARAQFKMCLYYENGIGVDRDPQQAAHYFHLLRNPSHPEGKYCIGERHANISYCYANGIGVERNEEKSRNYFLIAADLGRAEAQFCLCKNYSLGISVNKDPQWAAHYFQLLSNPNHDEVEYEIEKRYRMIGYCYAHGIGVQKNEDKANSYFKLAAELGDAEAKAYCNALLKNAVL